MAYKALQSFTSGDGKGGVIRYAPGEAIGSVEGWENLDELIASGFVGVGEGKSPKAPAAAKAGAKTPAKKPRT